MTNEQNTSYQLQLDEKVATFKSLFSPFTLPELAIYPSPSRHYRMRAEFTIWHNDEDIYHVIYNKDKKRIRVETYPAANELINQAMSALMTLLRHNLILRVKLFQIDYLSTLNGELLITLLYHRQLDEQWQQQAKQLKQSLAELNIHADIIGRATKQKICLDKDYVDEVLMIANKKYVYRQIENSFTQPNAYINTQMLTWAVENTQGLGGDLLELYCGNGNFSIALADNFRQVLATEISKISVRAAQYNIEVNQINNLKIARLSAQELTQTMNGVRAFNRLAGICLADYQCKTVLVDPPRGGLDDETLAMLSQYDVIIYISCNPITLQQNLSTLVHTHKIAKIALFDQFPYTNHIECGLILTKAAYQKG